MTYGSIEEGPFTLTLNLTLILILSVTKDRNSEGTSAYLTCCIYYHAINSEACNVLGHQDCRSAVCQMKPKIKEEQMAVLRALEREAITAALERLSIERKLYCIVFEMY